MAHITPPEPAIKLYQTGFDPEIDLLERAATGKSLSDLVMRIDDPLVIALDGGWGSGKSFFLKCWVGAHLQDHGNTSQTVYFDAFEHDFIDAPLASLMGVLAERLEPADGEKTKTGQTVAKATLTAFRQAALPLTRLGLAVATYGATEAAGALADSFINQASREIEKAAEDFWTRESGQRAAMAQFKDVLTSLTGTKDSPQKLIIVIDELDRCRPDYALSLLEIIKHFFAVPNVHFVLGVNMAQLENSVHARYGAGIDAGLYLQKFVGLTMRLPEAAQDHDKIPHLETYFRASAGRMGLNGDVILIVINVLKCYRLDASVSLRSAQRILARLALMDTESLGQKIHSITYVVSSLLVLKVLAPREFEELKKEEIAMGQITEQFHLSSKEPKSGNRLTYLLWRSWANYLDQDKITDRGDWGDFDPLWTLGNPQEELHTLIRDYLETFTLPDPNP